MSLFESASLVVTPNGTKASKLYAIKPTSGAGDLSVTRATTATRVNSAGLIESVAVNVPRLDYTNSTCPSILVEGQRTNILTYSEQFDNASWDKLNANITANNIISPDGTQNADLVTTTNNISRVQKGFISTPGNKTISCFIKAGTQTQITIQVYDGISDALAIFNLTNGTIVSTTAGVTAKIENYGNGWYRLTHTYNSQGLEYGPQFYPPGIGTYFIWGAQLEAATYPTSYIPTVASAVTRNADVISKTGISSLIGQTEGTIFVDFYYSGLADNHMIINDSSFTSYIYINSQIAGQLWGQIQNIGIQFSTIATAGRYKCALAYKSGNSAFYVNGVQVGTSATAFSLSNNIANLDYTISTPKNNINASALWKTRLTNTELATLTTI